ncbi:hypothetical protein F5Y19DRAFT_479136 [Xylariaceae sp. FL1651]|nr:hypothetical protein F5Y19DRAFT_479136 [Xylariaceae sp. FL1651]
MASIINWLTLSTPPLTFPQFERLPRELRDMIWNQAVSSAPSLQWLRFKDTIPDNLHSPFVAGDLPCSVSPHAFTLSQTCREARLISTEQSTFLISTDEVADNVLNRPAFQDVCKSIRTVAIGWHTLEKGERILSVLLDRKLFPQLKDIKIIERGIWHFNNISLLREAFSNYVKPRIWGYDDIKELTKSLPRLPYPGTRTLTLGNIAAVAFGCRYRLSPDFMRHYTYMWRHQIINHQLSQSNTLAARSALLPDSSTDPSIWYKKMMQGPTPGNTADVEWWNNQWDQKPPRLEPAVLIHARPRWREDRLENFLLVWRLARSHSSVRYGGLLYRSLIGALMIITITITLVFYALKTLRK